MLLKFSEECYQSLKGELAEIRETFTNEPERTSKSLTAIKAALEELTGQVRANPFASKAEEAAFNKAGYVPFYALYLYEVERYHTQNGRPHDKAEAVHKYYGEKLSAWAAYFRQHIFLYECYRKDLSELDLMLFVSGECMQNLYLPESPEFHAAGVPPVVYVFARFIALERITDETLKLLEPDAVHPENGKGKLHWTGSKVGVAELAYGLFYTGQFNNGTADVKQISQWLEESLGLDMSSVHRKFTDVRRRNTASPTKLLDRMREAINQRIDEDLAYKPNRGIKLKKPSQDDPDSDL
jgi:hypothetical protein